MSNYSKFKDRAPQDTIFEIQRILNEAGIFTVLKWVDKKYSGVYSNRVTMYPTELGSNGKGTDQLYATASAYAELMERIQNNLLAFRMLIPERNGKGEFIVQPDERVMSIDDVIAQRDPFLETFAREMGIPHDFGLKILLTNLAASCEHRTDGTILTVPYADLNGGRVVWLPHVLITEIYGSNGMAAGNTLEEAMVQGISELFERYANIKLLKGECVPPVIPDEALRPFSVWNLIDQIRAEGRYSIDFYDCSLGIGLPVAGTVITDLQTGSFCMKLGAHPSFAVAVERTLTETFQGHEKLDTAVSLCRIGSDEAARDYHNMPNVVKVGSGIYPAKMLIGDPGWEFRPWTQWEGLDNRAFLKKMLEQIGQLGYPILARDVSHLGFPSIHVLVPGFSEIYPINSLRVRSTTTLHRNADAVRHLPDLTTEEEKRFLRVIQFKEGSYIENLFSNQVMLPLTGKRMEASFVGAFLALKLGDFQEAGRFFRRAWNQSDNPGDRLYLHGLMEYTRFLNDGMDAEQALQLLHRMLRADIADRIDYEVRDPETMLQKVFPKLTCPDCASCPIAGTECLQPQEAELFRKLKTAMSRSRVSQAALLETLKDLMEA